MIILEAILSTLTQDAPVRSVLVGVHWTIVCSQGCGLASTITGGQPHGHDAVREVGKLHLKSARHLAEYALSENPLEASIGVAAINSLLPVDDRRAVEINAAEVLAERGRGKQVALVGHFPFIPRLKQQVGELWVIEQQPTDGEHPAEAARELIPQAQVVALTGSALINHTLDGLLELCQPGSYVMVLGPSTPLSPLWFDHGVTVISGTRVIDEAAAQRTVAQAANFRQVEGVRLLTFHK